jgi:glucose-1-phosphate thymidylyltransferase
MPYEAIMTERNLIGIVPAAGAGSRLNSIPGAKELIPIGFKQILAEDGIMRMRPKAVSEYLIASMAAAGLQKLFFVIRPEKEAILHYYGDGTSFGVNIAYLVIHQTQGMPFSINAAYPWVKDATVVFGMPDTIFTPPNAFELLIQQHEKLHADLTLGVFQTDQPSRFGMVDFNDTDHLLACIDKPPKTELKHMWGIACWQPVFSEYLNSKLATLSNEATREVVLSTFFQMAADEGLEVRVKKFDQGEYIDIGSPEDLAIAKAHFSARVERI